MAPEEFERAPQSMNRPWYSPRVAPPSVLLLDAQGTAVDAIGQQPREGDPRRELHGSEDHFTDRDRGDRRREWDVGARTAQASTARGEREEGCQHSGCWRGVAGRCLRGPQLATAVTVYIPGAQEHLGKA